MLGYYCSFFSIALPLIFIFFWKSARSHSLKLPPSPPKLPIFGNLLQLGSLPHQTLKLFADRYGPLITVYFGQNPAIVASSPEMAMEIMKTHDLVFADRPTTTITRKFLYDAKDLVSSPYSEHWRQMKSLCVTKIFSSSKVRSFRPLRDEETAVLVATIEEAGSSVINLSELFTNFANNMICRVAFGRQYTPEGGGYKKFKQLLDEFGSILATLDIGDFIPWLSWVNHINGFYAKAEKAFKELDGVFDEILDEHSSRSEGLKEDKMNFIDTMLQLQKTGGEDSLIDRDSIKGLIWALFAGGTDTTQSAMEWTMTELLRHPTAMKKTQEEIREVVGNKCGVSEEDLPKLNYLKAVIKESMRLHPPLPMLVPRQTREKVKVQGYEIPSKTTVFVNVWAMGRNPSMWEAPEEFRPERFLGKDIDMKGNNFELIPFGAGRRGCPGGVFAAATMEMGLATMLHNFEWILADGVLPENLDMTECRGLTLHRERPLMVVASKYMAAK